MSIVLLTGGKMDDNEAFECPDGPHVVLIFRTFQGAYQLVWSPTRTISDHEELNGLTMVEGYFKFMEKCAEFGLEPLLSSPWFQSGEVVRGSNQER